MLTSSFDLVVFLRTFREEAVSQNSLLTWRPKYGERILIGRLQACSITQLVVQTFQKKRYSLVATGMIGIMDHIENAGGEDHWIATSYTPFNTSRRKWYIRPIDNGEQFLCWREKSGEPVFTLDESINEGMRRFIEQKIEEHEKQILATPAVASQ